jgi:polyhydroxyalkanoate synthesis repressor PhaR
MNKARIIKKYPNRRLYDTTESRYIAFKDICKLAAEEMPFTVVESASGKDVTRPVLLQLIAELEARDNAFLSTPMLLRIVRAHNGHDSYDLTRSLVELLPETTRHSGT